ncbi:MAG: hypothetical protein H7Z12_06870 [Rhodospirillaceae bacterium]|nr:hypothetical protein [Rhodospirillales bacterium]
MLSDNSIEYYEAAWALRTQTMISIMDSETSLARALARMQEFESRHEIVLLDERLHYRAKPTMDPITRLETAIRAVSCGATAPGFAFTKVNFGEMIASFAHGCDCVAELGSGYGLRLFQTWLAGGPAEARYVGMEPTASGRGLAAKLAALEPGMRFESLAGDHQDFDPAALGRERTLFVTCFALQFAPVIPLDFFRRIAAIPGEVLCLFIEPVGFQISPTGDRAALQMEGARARNMNFDFLRTFNAAASEGLIEPLFIGRDLFGKQDDPFTQGSVILAAKS